MHTLTAVIVITIGIATSGCGAARSTRTTTPNVGPELTSAVVTFASGDHGKDAKSVAMVQLLKSNAEMSAQARTVGTKFDDHTTAAPMSLAMTAAFRRGDTDASRLRVHLTPDGQDDWFTDVRLTLTFSDGSVQRFVWNDVRLDTGSPERELSLAGARMN